jgi:cell volume regulation protein A
MEIALVIIFVGLLVFLAHAFVAVFDRTRVPDVLSLILIGLLIGPILRIVSPHDFGRVGHVFTIVALIIILFEAGIDLNIERIWTSLRSAVILTVVSYILAFILLFAVIFYISGLALEASLFVAAVSAGPAPAIVVPLVKNLSLHERARTMLTLESAVGEALCVLVSLGILEAMRFSNVQVGHVLGRLLSAFVFGVAVGLLGGYIWSLALNRVRELQHAIFTTPAFVFVTYGIAEILGFSGPVAALAFGVTLGNPGLLKIPHPSRYSALSPIGHNETERLFFGEIAFLLRTFFFVYIGLSIQLSDVRLAAISGGLVLVLLVARLIAVRVSVDKMTTSKDAAMMSVIIPKGTATAVLASLPLQLGLASAQAMQELTYGLIVASCIVTALFIFFLEKTSLSKAYGLVLKTYRTTLEASEEKPLVRVRGSTRRIKEGT